MDVKIYSFDEREQRPVAQKRGWMNLGIWENFVSQQTGRRDGRELSTANYA